MIEASFEQGRGRSAAVSGAYQYDTGQRIRMHGLPGPEELARRDMDDPPITPENYDEIMARMETYLGEFEQHGTDNITVDMEE